MDGITVAQNNGGPMISEQLERSEHCASYQPQCLRRSSAECGQVSKRRTSKTRTPTKREGLNYLKTAMDGEYSGGVHEENGGGTAPPTPDGVSECGKEWHMCMRILP